METTTARAFGTDERLTRLLKIIQLVEPDTSIAYLVDDEGHPYIHLGTPDGRIDYFIQPAGDAWEGKPRGRIGLPPTEAATAGGVAAAVASWFATWLKGVASAAHTILVGR